MKVIQPYIRKAGFSPKVAQSAAANLESCLHLTTNQSGQPSTIGAVVKIAVHARLLFAILLISLSIRERKRP